jgi:hypothetical protein
MFPGTERNSFANLLRKTRAKSKKVPKSRDCYTGEETFFCQRLILRRARTNISLTRERILEMIKFLSLLSLSRPLSLRFAHPIL